MSESGDLQPPARLPSEHSSIQHSRQDPERVGPPSNSRRSVKKRGSTKATLEAQADTENAMVKAQALMHKLGIASIAGFLHEGVQYKAVKSSRRAIRAFEGAPVDGGWNWGPLGNITADSTYAERLEQLLLAASEDPANVRVALQDTKASIGTLVKDPDLTRTPALGFTYSDKQHISVANLNIANHASPGMAVLSPVHSTQNVRYRDVLLYESKVR